MSKFLRVRQLYKLSKSPIKYFCCKLINTYLYNYRVLKIYDTYLRRRILIVLRLKFCKLPKLWLTIYCQPLLLVLNNSKAQHKTRIIIFMGYFCELQGNEEDQDAYGTRKYKGPWRKEILRTTIGKIGTIGGLGSDKSCRALQLHYI